MMIVRYFAVCAAVIGSMGVCHAAVEAEENLLLNGALEADQATMPPYWNVNRKDTVSWRPSGGPEGRPYISFAASKVLKEEITFRQYGLRLAEGGTYRLSASVRTRGLSLKSGGVSIVNNWWNKSAGAGKLPPDTAGEWVTLENEFKCFPSDNGAYSAVVYAIGMKGEFDVADIKLVAVDELARTKTERSPVLSAQTLPRLIPFSPILGRIPLADPRIDFRGRM